MAYVTVPKDLSKIKTKVAFNLTKRQIVCLGAALLVGLPLFFLLKGNVGTTLAAMAMIVVTHTEAGEGLIFYGNVVLPFIDRFPKDTELYRVMTTKPEEVGDA